MYMIMYRNGESVKSVCYIPESSYNPELHISRRVNVLFVY